MRRISLIHLSTELLLGGRTIPPILFLIGIQSIGLVLVFALHGAFNQP